MIIVRYADDYLVGFEREHDARRFLADLRQRLAAFSLELEPNKTRLIQFGRFAARDRARRGLGKPETFDFLGFTHCCARTKNGRFLLKRITIAKRMRVKLREVKDELMRRRHHAIPEQGRWLASVLRGHYLLRRARQQRPHQPLLQRGHPALAARSAQAQPTTPAALDAVGAAERPMAPTPGNACTPSPARFAATTQGRSPVR